MQIKFCGAAQEVTGSCHLVTLENGYNILLDCGLFQGDVENLEELNRNWLFNPAEIDVLILSHAHIDHCGRIPKLVKDGFKGNIYCTPATRDLATIMLMDAAHIQERDLEYYNEKIARKRKKLSGSRENFPAAPTFEKREILYTARDVKEAMNLFVGVSYDRWIEVTKGVKVMFSDAGHILGSACINLIIQQGGDNLRLAFSGDIGRPNRPILRDPQPMNPADVLITESTYGDMLHIEKPAEKNRFLNIIHETCTVKKGKLIIPAFSLGRTQELVFILDQLVNEKRLPNYPVFVDSPLAVNATSVFRTHPECFDYDLHQYILKDPDPFGFNSLHYVTDVNESKGINELDEPCIIISASGMANAGRIRHHLYNNIDQSRNTILIVGYCSPNTPGGQLRAGMPTLKLFGDVKPVRANVEIMDSFSAHGDQQEMRDFLENQKDSTQKIFLVHGELETQLIYKDYLQNKQFKNLFIPKLNETFEI
ncbi:MAG: MBL fold metallo-hydrolase [Bacteroidota bacterium]|nr:MBL fold metallo-hydrolase [Bacteroidota bacterium]